MAKATRKKLTLTIDPKPDHATPMYVQLILQFRAQIETGAWKVGEKIPVIEQLVSEFGVARGTVRQALGLLASEGLIDSRRGRGTVVVHAPKRSLWMNLSNSWEDLVKGGGTLDSHILELPVFTHVEAEAVIDHGILAPSYVVIRRLLLRDGIPYLVGVSSIDRRILEEIGLDNWNPTAIYRKIDRSRRSRPLRGNQELTVDPADAEMAFLLKIPPESPVVTVTRWILDRHENLIYKSRGHFRGDFVHVNRRLR